MKASFFVALTFVFANAALPVVLWHGLGDSSAGMMPIALRIKASLPGVTVLAVQIGATPAEDTRAGFFGSIFAEVSYVCEQLLADSTFASGVNVVGFSQGGLFARALVQRCAGVTFHNLISLGSPHAGVSSLPSCTGEKATAFCQEATALVKRSAYSPAVFGRVIQAQYFRAGNETEYLLRNTVLPFLNNEVPEKIAAYSLSIIALRRFVMFRFSDDVTVVPRDSAWFSVLQGTEVVPLQTQLLWTEDWLGLRALDEAGGVFFGTIPGVHMQFTLDWFDENVVTPYLSDDKAAA